jgi:hypothetical protein
MRRLLIINPNPSAGASDLVVAQMAAQQGNAPAFVF